MSHESRVTKILYGIFGTGVMLAFLGHGVLGAKGKESFIELVTGSYSEVLGGTMSASTAETYVNVIGWVDIALAAVILTLVYAAIREHPIAYSRVALGVFGWAAVWGFLTALSRFTAGFEGIAIWDVVERGPNYLLPAGIVYIVYKVRQERMPRTRAESYKAPSATPAVPAH